MDGRPSGDRGRFLTQMGGQMSLLVRRRNGLVPIWCNIIDGPVEGAGSKTGNPTGLHLWTPTPKPPCGYSNWDTTRGTLSPAVWAMELLLLLLLWPGTKLFPRPAGKLVGLSILDPHLGQKIILRTVQDARPSSWALTPGSYSVTTQQFMSRHFFPVMKSWGRNEVVKLLTSSADMEFPVVNSQDAMVLLGSIPRAELLRFLRYHQRRIIGEENTSRQESAEGARPETVGWHRLRQT
ncbi:CLCKB protein, partial [Polypterus senegalus]